MSEIIQLVLALLQAIIPQLSTANAALIEKIVEGLIALLPILVKEYQDLLPIVKNVITALKANGAVTPEQILSLQAAEAQIDAAFDTAAAKAIAEDI